MTYGGFPEKLLVVPRTGRGRPGNGVLPGYRDPSVKKKTYGKLRFDGFPKRPQERHPQKREDAFVGLTNEGGEERERSLGQDQIKTEKSLLRTPVEIK